MQKNVDLQILEMNFLEFLTSFLEGRTTLSMILQLNERIYTRDHTTLSESLIAVSTELHNLKKRLDRGEQIDKEIILNVVNDNVLAMIGGQGKIRG